MKLSISFALQYFITFHYIVFFFLAIFLTPARNIRPTEKISEVKIDKMEKDLARENTEEILHGELLFR